MVLDEDVSTTAANGDQRVGKKKGRRRNKVVPCKTVGLASKQFVKMDVHELEVENAPDGIGGKDHTLGGTSAQMSRDLDNGEGDAFEDGHFAFKDTGTDACCHTPTPCRLWFKHRMGT